MRAFLCTFLTCCCFAAGSSPLGQSGALAFEARPGGYVSHGRGYAFSLASGGAVLNIGGHRMRMAAVAANPRPSLQALDPMPGKANYIFGATRASYNLYGRVRWRGVYPGIDVDFHGNQEYLEYDFEIAPRRDPRHIQLAFDGVDGMRIDASGDLLLRAGALEIRQPKPLAYQIVAGKKQPVDAAYWIDARNRVRFRTGVYDRNRVLVIDPEIVFEQTFGGSGVTLATGLARDSQGNLYVTGNTSSVDFPTLDPLQSKLGSAPLIVSSDGGKSWSDVFLGTASQVNFIAAAPSAPLVTYAATPTGIFSSADGGSTWTATASAGLPLPATNPEEAITALAVDAQSSSTLYAATSLGPFVSQDGAATWQLVSNGLPSLNVTAMAAHPTQAGTVFVSVSQSPALFRSTNFGQSWTPLPTPAPSNPNAPIYGLAIGSNGTIVAASYNGPIIVSSDNGNTWTTGANQGGTNNQALAISPANPGTVYLAINTGVLKSSDGGQTFNSVLSFPAPETSNQVAVDPTNPATVYAATFGLVYQSTNAGLSWSQLTTPYPIAANTIFVSPANAAVFVGSEIESDVFVTKWSPDGSQMLYSTYFGGSGTSGTNGIAVDAAGNAYLTGTTSSPGFPTTPGAFQTKLTASQDAFVAKLNPEGSQIVYATLLGAKSAFPNAIAVDGSGEAVIAGTTGVSVPTTPNALPVPPLGTCTSFGGVIGFTTTADAFVTKFAASGGSLVFSTLLGGSCGASGNQIAIDANGNTWVVGSTLSPDFPVTADALQPKYGGGTSDGDGYLASFSPSGTLTYATYIGGPGYDTLNAIAFDSSGNIYLTGESAGLSQPASPGAYQSTVSASCFVLSIGPPVYEPQGNGLVLKLDPTAHKVEGLTYLGAPGCLYPNSIAVDSSGEPWIAASSQTPNNIVPLVNPVEIGGPGFISKFSTDLTQLLFSTQFNSVVGLAINAQGLAYVAGSASSNPATGTTSAYLAEVDSAQQPVTIQSIVSPDSSKNPATIGGISPGELLQITGANLGPATAAPGIVSSGVLATSVAGVEVTFDGVTVPLLAVSEQQIELMTPFELTGKLTTTIQVQYNGVKSNAVQVPVAAIEVQILGVFNDDFTPNSAANPAAAGSEMCLYAGGVGNANPPSQDGHVNGPPFEPLALPVQVLWFGASGGAETLPLFFAGSAPGTVAGIFQVNFAAPSASEGAELAQVLGPNTFSAEGNFQIYVKQ